MKSFDCFVGSFFGFLKVFLQIFRHGGWMFGRIKPLDFFLDYRNLLEAKAFQRVQRPEEFA